MGRRAEQGWYEDVHPHRRASQLKRNKKRITFLLFFLLLSFKKVPQNLSSRPSFPRLQVCFYFAPVGHGLRGYIGANIRYQTSFPVGSASGFEKESSSFFKWLNTNRILDSSIQIYVTECKHCWSWTSHGTIQKREFETFGNQRFVPCNHESCSTSHLLRKDKSIKAIQNSLISCLHYTIIVDGWTSF